jgi:Reverse transcriptase (RNA-dependent DNA polymerase)
VRYADDFIVGFQHEADARRFWDDMRKRFEEFSLSLNPDKTRLIEFGRFAAERRAQRGLGKPKTFNFLGFTFICERNSRGRFLVKRITRRDRMRATLREIKEELRRRMHRPIPEQGAWIKQVVRGFFAYHAVPTNGAALRCPIEKGVRFQPRQCGPRKNSASRMSEGVGGELFVPENGLISINPPLTRRRVGSLSTRTTHPHFVSWIQTVFDSVRLGVTMVNLYRWKTKGEMLEECVDPTIAEMAAASYSCGKGKRLNKHCGRCVPCER